MERAEELSMPMCCSLLEEKSMTDRDQTKKSDPDNDMPENIKRDPNRDLSHVPGSFNPGNQAGKGRDVEEDRTRQPDDTRP
jgi:hypothetical protein